MSLDPEVEGLELFAFVGRDERAEPGTVGLKQAWMPAGLMPLVVIAGHREKLVRPEVLRQLRGQAVAFGRTIRLVRFVAVEEVLTVGPEKGGVS